MKNLNELIKDLEYANSELDITLDIMCNANERLLLAKNILSDRETIAVAGGEIQGSNDQQRKASLAIITREQRKEVEQAEIAKYKADKDYEKARRKVYFIQDFIRALLGYAGDEK